jgi:hypothetical protein
MPARGFGGLFIAHWAKLLSLLAREMLSEARGDVCSEGSL